MGEAGPSIAKDVTEVSSYFLFLVFYFFFIIFIESVMFFICEELYFFWSGIFECFHVWNA